MNRKYGSNCDNNKSKKIANVNQFNSLTNSFTVSLVFLGKRKDKIIKPKPLDVIIKARLLKIKFHLFCFFKVLYRIKPPKAMSNTIPIKNIQSAIYLNSKMLLDIVAKYLG